ncbi:MAG: uncharacterized protein QOK15_3812 [Nocardioidaceae bacterium]|nr:uncharacterized protein [Nocardioidaceae bacterium]
MSQVLGRVRELHRYPVKSCAGERPDSLEIEERGVVGDRLWAILDPDGKLGSGKSSRRFRRMDGLQRLRSRYDGAWPVITFPDGTEVRADDDRVHELLTAYVGRPVTLGREQRISHFDEGPLHLVSTATLDAIGSVDARRLRPNLVLDLEDHAGNEEDWSGRQVSVGDEVVVAVLYAMPRCVMLDHEQADLPPADGLLKTVTARRDGNAGIVADVVHGGTVRIRDEVRLSG